MTLFIDTSALLKRYVQEAGSDEVLRTMREDTDWVASAVAETEAELALCRLIAETESLEAVRERFRKDWERILVVPVDPECLRKASEIGCAHGLRILHAVPVAAATRLPAPVTFLTFDKAQAAGATSVGMTVLPFTTPD